MYLFLIPLFLVAVVPEGFFTWQVILIFAGVMIIPFAVMWLKFRKEPTTSFSDQYIESLRRDNEIREQLIRENQSRKENL
jgi:hypothetical protein